MAFKDLREYIAALEEHGELRRVSREVDWNLEVGAIIRLANEKGLPSPFFQKIKGYPSGYMILGAPMDSYRKIAIAMGLSPKISPAELMNIYYERIQKPIKPVIVDKSKAPCKENIDIGNKINLAKFPIPMLHDGDGGRYLSWHINITKDPDTGWVNWGTYRVMITSKNTMTGFFAGGSHMAMHFRKYKSRKLSMPFAIAVGPEPICGFVGGTKPSVNVNEADVAGALRQEPVELVKCETVGLEVPATAEIVIEGELSTTETDWEGPFGEFTGYGTSPRERRPIYKVKAVTYRSEPILTQSCYGVPPNEYGVLVSLVKPAEFLRRLQAEAIPVVAVNVVSECSGLMAIVSVRTRPGGIPNVAERVSAFIWGTALGAIIPYVIVVEDDVDVFNLSHVFHALANKCHPYRGIRRIQYATAVPLQPFLNPYERSHHLGARAVFDCTFPLDWDPINEVPPKISFDTNYPKELKDYVLKNWENYGFDKLT